MLTRSTASSMDLTSPKVMANALARKGEPRSCRRTVMHECRELSISSGAGVMSPTPTPARNSVVMGASPVNKVVAAGAAAALI